MEENKWRQFVLLVIISNVSLVVLTLSAIFIILHSK